MVSSLITMGFVCVPLSTYIFIGLCFKSWFLFACFLKRQGHWKEWEMRSGRRKQEQILFYKTDYSQNGNIKEERTKT